MGMDGDWCSLQEIGPLSQLKDLTLFGLENVSAGPLAEKASISSKDHLSYLELNWSNSRFMGLRDENERQQQQQTVEEVLEKLHPPSSMEDLNIQGYFGRKLLPNWMMASATWAFKSLRYLRLEDFPCCTELPDGLCRLPSLEALHIENAPAIRRVGPEFQSPSSLVARSAVAFPHLTFLRLADLCEWEEWDWEEQGEDEILNHVDKMFR